MTKRKKTKPKIILGAGGTGGHLFPAQVVASQLSEKCECLFVGGLLSQNRFFNKSQFPYKEISAAPLSFHPKKIFNLLKGTKDSLSIISAFKPDLVIGFGSYFTFPLLAAASLKKIPIFLHEQNALPGRVNRLFSPLAKLTAISFPKTHDLLKGKNICEVAFPLRAQKYEKDPFAYYHFDPQKPTLLIFGGSQGAKALNHLFFQTAKNLPHDLQILHFTGDKEISKKAIDLYQSLGKTFVVKEFEDNMPYALSVASIAITRAGASTIAELIQWEMPSLVIPFPHAKDNHQYENAKYFVDVVQGGELLFQEEATPELLTETLFQLLEEKDKKRKTIQEHKKTKSLKEFSELIMGFFEGD